MLFKFKAQKADGSIYESEKEAVDKFSLYREIKREGDTVIKAEEANAGKSFNLNRLSRFFGSIKLREKIVFAKNLGGMLRAGLAISRALDVLERQEKNAKFRKVISDLKTSVSRGEPLDQALLGHGNVFPPLFVSMVKAGQESGSLPESLIMVASQMDKMYALQKKVKGALVYPLIIVCLMVVIAIIMLIFIVPNLTKTFTELNIELPLSTQLVVKVSSLILSDGILLASIVILCAISLLWFAGTKGGKKIFHYAVLKIPIIGNLIKEVNSARTARTLSSLLKSGVDVVESLSITEEIIQNVYYKEVLKEAEDKIKKGTPLSSVFASNEHLYPAFVGEMASVGEETGKLSDMFSEIASFYENNVDQETKNLSTVIEPFLMVFIGIGVGFFAIAMISPTLSLVNAL